MWESSSRLELWTKDEKVKVIIVRISGEIQTDGRRPEFKLQRLHTNTSDNNKCSRVHLIFMEVFVFRPPVFSIMRSRVAGAGGGSLSGLFLKTWPLMTTHARFLSFQTVLLFILPSLIWDAPQHSVHHTSLYFFFLACACTLSLDEELHLYTCKMRLSSLHIKIELAFHLQSCTYLQSHAIMMSHCDRQVNNTHNLWIKLSTRL